MPMFKRYLVICALVVSTGGAMFTASHASASGPNLGSCISAGTTIYAGQYLANAGYELLMQTDGNLVQYNAVKALWATQTSGNTHAILQSNDGNFVVYSATQALWSAAVPSSPGDRLCLQTDGNLVIYSANNAALWNTGDNLSFAGSPPATATGGNGYNSTQCTWRAEQSAHDWMGIWPQIGGNARYWYANAQANLWSTGTQPRIGSIVVFQPTIDGASSIGHVAWVIDVYPSRQGIEVFERNYNDDGLDGYRYNDPNSGTSPFVNDTSKIGYIYFNP